MDEADELDDEAAEHDPPRAPKLRRAARVSLGAMLWELVKVNAVVIVLVLAMRAFVVEAYVVHGASMEPTFEHSQRLLITKFSPSIDELERFDIVVFDHPHEPGKRLIKRIVALPGEVIEVRTGRVYIDGAPIDEPYVVGADGTSFERHVVAPGCFFVLGDNRAVSNDSRRIGDVRVESIIGRAVVRFYPWDAVRFF